MRQASFQTNRQRLCWLLLAGLVFHSCIPLGLPEKFAAVSADETLFGAPSSKFSSNRVLHRLSASFPKDAFAVAPSLLLVSDMPQPQVFESSPVFFGHQYLLGFIPFTSLYFQHSAQTLLLETSLSTFQEQGFKTYVTTHSKLEDIASVLRPRFIVEPKITSLTINAYDALFFRILKVAAQLTLTSYKTQNGTALTSARRIQKTINEKKFKRFGHAPMLAYMTQAILSKSLKEALPELIESNRRQSSARQALYIKPGDSSSSSPAVFIAPPSYNIVPPLLLGEILASSYGYHSQKPFSNLVILRLIQRGIEMSFNELGLPAVSALKSHPLPKDKNSWFLETTVESIGGSSNDLSENHLQLKLSFTLNKLDTKRKTRMLLTATCSTKQELLSNLDGSWVVTLEKAAFELMHQFLLREEKAAPQQGAVCTYGSS